MVLGYNLARSYFKTGSPTKCNSPAAEQPSSLQDFHQPVRSPFVSRRESFGSGGVGGGGGVSFSGAASKRMNTLLTSHGLESYAPAFIAGGFTTPFKISVMTPADVNSLKMKLIHKKKLSKLLLYFTEHPPKPDRPSLPVSSAAAPVLASFPAPPPSNNEAAAEDFLDEEPTYVSSTYSSISPARSSAQTYNARHGESQESSSDASDSSGSADFFSFMNSRQPSSSSIINEGAETNSTSPGFESSGYAAKKAGLPMHKNRRRTPRDEKKGGAAHGMASTSTPPKAATVMSEAPIARDDDPSLSPPRAREQRGRSREASPRGGSHGSLTSPNRIQMKKQIGRELPPGMLAHAGTSANHAAPASPDISDEAKKKVTAHSSGSKSSRHSRNNGQAVSSSSPYGTSPPESPSKWQQQMSGGAPATPKKLDDDFTLLSAKLSERFSLFAQKAQRRPKATPNYSTSAALAEMERKEGLLISSITTQTQRLDATRANVEALEAEIKEREEEQAIDLTKLKKELEKTDLNWVATKTEHDIFKEKVGATAEHVEELSTEEAALDARIFQEKEELTAKDEKITSILTRNENIKKESQELQEKIASMQKTLEEHKWKGKVASRHERLVKASYSKEGPTKYGNVRYTMYTKPKSALT